MTLEDELKGRAHELGFALVGITGAEPSAFAAEYRAWIDQGYAGEMDYLARNLERRLDSRELIPGARSLVMVGMEYYTGGPDGPGTPPPDPGAARFARYARGDDYHDVMTPRLRSLLAWLLERAGTAGASGRVYVDTGPLLEREAAQRAGLGWFGKNTLLINTRRGSYFLLGAIVTTLELQPDSPAVGGCGTCRLCIDACPTGAIVAPYQVDSRRCLSYLTIELKGVIPEELTPALAASDGRIFGCDICQEVCPFNARRAVPTTEPAFQPRAATTGRTLADLALLSEEQFREQFRRSPVKRAKWRGLLRNVAAALSALDDSIAETDSEYAMNHNERLEREHPPGSSSVPK